MATSNMYKIYPLIRYNKVQTAINKKGAQEKNIKNIKKDIEKMEKFSFCF